MKTLNRKSAGMTLLELLISIALISIVTTFALPSFHNLLKSMERRSVTSDLVSLINLARTTAIEHQTAVTLCPLDQNNRCTHNWSLPVVAFKDSNRDRILSTNSDIIRTYQTASGKLEGNAGIRNYFRFRATGLAQEAIGNLTWCPHDRDSAYAAQIRINMGGRPYVAKDSNGDGFVENAVGDPVRCT
jgi:type IV fimbrial biogenesis protein FimT